MSEVEVIRVIRTTLKTVGKGVGGDPVHRHTQYWDMDGGLLWEDCDGDYCEDGESAAEVAARGGFESSAHERRYQ